MAAHGQNPVRVSAFPCAPLTWVGTLIPVRTGMHAQRPVGPWKLDYSHAHGSGSRHVRLKHVPMAPAPCPLQQPRAHSAMGMSTSPRWHVGSAGERWAGAPVAAAAVAASPRLWCAATACLAVSWLQRGQAETFASGRS